MVLFNYSTKELTAKIVYYGPGLCGKTTNLHYIFENLPPTIHKGKMLSLATKTDRTLFFDFLPIDLGTIRGMRTRLQLYTVPGQVFYNTTRKLVLKGADGLVFVADSQRKMIDANTESFGNLEENLAEHGMTLAEMPHIIQFNKRDLPGVGTTEELNAALNKYNAPIYEAVATTGIGVHDTLKAVTRLVLNSLKERYGDKRRGEREPAAMAAVVGGGAKPVITGAAAKPKLETAPPAARVPEPEPAILEVEIPADERIETAQIEDDAISLDDDQPILAVEESPLSLDEPVEAVVEEEFPPRPAMSSAPEIEIESPLEPAEPLSATEEEVEEPVEPIEISEPESFEVETAYVDPPPAASRRAPPYPATTPSTSGLSGISAETRAVPFAGAEGGAGATREASFPIVINLQGQPVQIMLTVSVRIEKS